MTRRKLLIGAAMFSLVPVWGCADNNVAMTEEVRNASPQVLELVDWFVEMAQNRVAAQAKYEGKVIQVTARIDVIGSSGSRGEVSMFLPGKESNLTCTFASKDAVMPLKVGQIVTIKGICTLASPSVSELSGCIIVS